MNRNIYLFLILALLFSASSVIAQEGETEIPVGMELLQDGTLKVIVPKDAARRQERNMTIVESSEVYFARRFVEMEERFAEVELKTAELKQEVGQLKEVLVEINEKLAAMAEEEDDDNDDEGESEPEAP